MLGASFILALKGQHELIGTYGAHPVALDGISFLHMDLADGPSIPRVFEEVRPDLVVHAAALTNIDLAEREPHLAEIINVDGSRFVARAARRVGSRMVAISTDAVFDGSAGPKTEDDEPRPLNVYGRTKLDGEQAVLAEHPDALVVRTTPVGFSPRGDQLAGWILGRLRSGQAVPGFVDAIFSPIDADALCQRVLALLTRGERGVYHVAGGSRVSKHAFARELARATGLDPTSVVEARLRDLRFVAPRGRDLSLSADRSSAVLGQPAPDVSQVVDALAALERSGRPKVAASMLVAPALREDDLSG